MTKVGDRIALRTLFYIYQFGINIHINKKMCFLKTYLAQLIYVLKQKKNNLSEQKRG